MRTYGHSEHKPHVIEAREKPLPEKEQAEAHDAYVTDTENQNQKDFPEYQGATTPLQKFMEGIKSDG